MHLQQHRQQMDKLMEMFIAEVRKIHQSLKTAQPASGNSGEEHNARPSAFEARENGQNDKKPNTNVRTLVR